MDEKKRINRLIISLVLVALSFFALISFFSHSPNDPPFGNYPVNNPINNFCGIVGAELSGYMFLGLGISSFIPFIFMGAVGVLLFIHGRIDKLWIKVFGIVLFVVCLAPIIYMAGSLLKIPFLKEEYAGISGLIIAKRLIESCGIAGTSILFATGVVISGILITDSKINAIFKKILFRKADDVRKSTPGSKEVDDARKSTPGSREGGIGKLAELFSALRNINLPKIDFKSFMPDLFHKKNKSDEGVNPEAEVKDEPVVKEKPIVENEPVVMNEPVVEEKPVVKNEPVIVNLEDKEEAGTGNEAEIEDDETDENGDEALVDTERVNEGDIGGHNAVRVRLARNDEPEKKSHVQNYALPTIDLLDDPEPVIQSDNREQLMERASIVQMSLKQFNVDVRVVEIEQGPVITMFELELAPGVKVAKIIALSDDLAIALKAPSVRVVAPLPRKSSVGLEVPNSNRRVVKLKEVIETGGPFIKKQQVPLILGKDVSGAPLISDMTAMPHLLIAGTTGSGKSVCLNTIILSVLCFQRPDQVKLLLVDPKMVEFSPYNDVPHLISPIITDMKKAAAVLEWAVNKMEERYALLSVVGVRNIESYNNLGEQEIRKRLRVEPDADLDDVPFHLPFIIIIVDELADLMMIAAKEVECSVIRLSQKSRAVGIHLILATQRPSVNVVTGLIKSNMPSRISFFVASKIDSRTILDQNGAEKLLGAGDMLFLPPGTSKLVRCQSAYVSDEEVRNVVDYLKARAQPEYSPELKQWKGTMSKDHSEEDELFNEAVRVVLESQRGSVSLVQRRLGVGYSRAARLIDLMADDGIIGEYKGSQAREVLWSLDDWEGFKDNDET